MSTVKIRSLTTTATTTASDDFLVIDGTTNSTRKISAATPAFFTSVTVPTIATAAGVNLNLATGTAASDKVLIPGTLEATAADGLAASVATLGGASVKKALWVGGIINVAGHTTFEGVTSTGATGTGKLVYDTSPSLTTPALDTPSALVGTNITGTAAGLTAGNVTTNANLTGDVTSVGNATSIAAGVIVNADINASAAIVDTKLDTIATALKVSNSATTAASANTASAIVARDASGNFSAGTVSAALTGNASTATALATGRTIAITGDLAYTSPSFDGSGNVTAAGTLASVASAGTSGGSTAIPVVTINAKGLTTSITTAAVIAPAGTLTGATLASGVTASSLTSLGTIANLTATAGTITTTPSASTDIANKLYVDTVAQGLDAKASCIAATTADITLSGTQTIDGISVIAADRVLVKDQTLSQNNGIYLCAAGAWTRTTDADTWDELTSAFTFIETGTVNADTGWVCTANAGGTLGTTALPWSQFSGAGSYTASTGLTLTGTAFSLTAPVTVALGGTNATSAGIASFNNITGYTASGATGTTSTDLVFSTSPTLVTPNIGVATGTSLAAALNGSLGATTPSTVAATTISSTTGANFATSSGNVGIGTASPSAKLDVSVGDGGAVLQLSRTGAFPASLQLNYGSARPNIVYTDGTVLTISDLATNTAQKDLRLGLGHYTNSEEPMGLIFGASGATTNVLSIGGGTSVVNAATEVAIFAAANNTTVTGTKIGSFTSTGLNSTAIGATTPAQGNFTFLYQGTSAAQGLGAGFSGAAGQGFTLRDTTNSRTYYVTTETATGLQINAGANPITLLGNTAITGTLSASGESTLTGRVTTAGGFTATATLPTVVASSANFDYNSTGSNGRLIVWGPDVSTSGNLTINLARSDGSNFVTPVSVSSTGAAITGTLSATGQITSTTTGQFFLNNTPTTQANYMRLTNTSGNMYFGLEGATPVLGGTAYDTVLVGKTGLSLSGNDGGGTQLRVTSAGAAITGTLSATSTVSITGTSTAVYIGNQASGGGGATLRLAPSNTVTNWLVSANQITSGAFEITPSTAGGGTTFSTPSFIIDSSSNVGIGTTSPQRRLHVSGGAIRVAYSGTDGGYIEGATTANVVQAYLSLGASYDVGSAQDIGLGIPAAAAASRYIYVRNRTAGVYLADGGTSWTSNSDERAKDIIEPITNAVNKVSSLRAVIGKYKTDVEGTRRSFLIAQDVQSVLPEAVDTTNPDNLGVQYTDIIPLLVASIKELTARLEALESK